MSANDSIFHVLDNTISQYENSVRQNKELQIAGLDSLLVKCIEHSYTPGIAAVNKLKGIQYFRNHKANSAYKMLIQSLALYKTLEDSADITTVSLLLTNYYIKQHQYTYAQNSLLLAKQYYSESIDKALLYDINFCTVKLKIATNDTDYIQNDIELLEAKIKTEDVGTLYYLKTKLFFLTQEFDSAFYYLSQGRIISNENNDIFLKTRLTILYGDILMQWADYEAALNNYLTALNYNTGNLGVYDLVLYTKIAETYLDMQNYQLAKEYLLKSEHEQDKYQVSYYEGLIPYLRGYLALKTKKYVKAEYELYEAKKVFERLKISPELFQVHDLYIQTAIASGLKLEVGESLNYLESTLFSLPSTELRISALKTLADYYKFRDKTKYYQFLEFLTEARNNQTSIQQYKDFLNTQIKFQNKSTSIKIREQQQELSEIKADFKTQRWIIIVMVIASFAILIFLIVIVRFFNENKRSTKQLITKNQEIIKSKEALIKAKDKAEESDRLKSSFLANMSHEIRTPMNSIIGFTNLLSQDNLPVDKREKYKKIVERNGRNLVDLIDDIIDLSKIESNQLDIRNELCQVNSLLQSLKSFYDKEVIRSQKNDLVIRLVIPSTNVLHSFMVDVFRLKQVLSNLLSNAVKFTERGVIEFGYTLNGNVIKFFVQDTGIGIDDKYKELIFKRFRQVDESVSREFGGTGLGLTLSEALIELMRGKIWFLSDLNKGTVFYFTLPLLKPVYSVSNDLETSINNGMDAVMNWKGKVILVTEDEDDNFMLIREILEPTCIKILRAKNGKEAVDMIKSHPEIKLVLMDIKMPVMNGYEATMHIKDYSSEIIVIAQTAFALSEDQSRGKNAGCDSFIPKPIKSNELIEEIARYVN